MHWACFHAVPKMVAVVWMVEVWRVVEEIADVVVVVVLIW